MATILILTCQLSAAPAAHWVEFIGFDKNERLAAYRHDVRRPRDDGAFDQYSVIQTIDVKSGYPVATFKASAIERIRPTGAPVRTPKAALLADNPEFARAYPNVRWRRLEKRSGFEKTRLRIDGTDLRIANDDVEQQEQKGALLVAHPRGGSLAFQIEATDANGRAISIAELEQTAEKDHSVLARTEVFVSRSGRAAAVVALFLVDTGKSSHTTPSIVVTKTDTRLTAARSDAGSPHRPHAARSATARRRHAS